MSQPWTARWLRSIAAGGGGSGDTSTDGGPTTTTTLAGGGIRRPPRPRPIQASSPSHPRRTGGATRTPRSASSPPSTPRAAEPQEGMIARQQWRLEPVRDTPFVSPARCRPAPVVAAVASADHERMLHHRTQGQTLTLSCTPISMTVAAIPPHKSGAAAGREPSYACVLNLAVGCRAKDGAVVPAPICVQNL